MLKKALIAMSGGVDSSVAAYLMKQAGYECIGAVMGLYGKEDKVKQNINDAKEAAKRLSIPFYIFDFKEEFEKEVIERFIRTYEKGETPNPCIYCNKYLKFGLFYEKAVELSCDYIVTGHYARIIKGEKEYELRQAVYKEKDQSYVLYCIPQEILLHTVFPLGELSKEEVRRIAAEQGFLNSQKPDSQDICFIDDGDYGRFLREYTKKDYPCGDFVDFEGNILGKHKGIINYTIGQRKGLGISAANPYYVCRISPEENQVVLGSNGDLFTKSLTASDINWTVQKVPSFPFRTQAKIRYRQEKQWAVAETARDGGLRLTFDEPQRAVTKGQAVVLYDDDKVLGGGIISG